VSFAYPDAHASIEVPVADPVASPATATAVPVLLYRSVFAADMIAFAFEIVSMTGRAEGCVLGPGPGNGRAYRIAVTAVTARVSSVVSRVVSIRIMAETGWRPAVGGMADVALCRCRQVCSRFEGRAATR